VCQVTVCEALTCLQGYEAVAVATAAESSSDDGACCPKTICVPMTALPMVGRRCPPLVEPVCGEHQVAMLVTDGSPQACSRLVCGRSGRGVGNASFKHLCLFIGQTSPS
jgi:hypothetical protein